MDDKWFERSKRSLQRRLCPPAFEAFPPSFPPFPPSPPNNGGAHRVEVYSGTSKRDTQASSEAKRLMAPWFFLLQHQPSTSIEVAMARRIRKRWCIFRGLLAVSSKAEAKKKKNNSRKRGCLDHCAVIVASVAIFNSIARSPTTFDGGRNSWLSNERTSGNVTDQVIVIRCSTAAQFLEPTQSSQDPCERSWTWRVRKWKREKYRRTRRTRKKTGIYTKCFRESSQWVSEWGRETERRSSRKLGHWTDNRSSAKVRWPELAEGPCLFSSSSLLLFLAFGSPTSW